MKFVRSIVQSFVCCDCSINKKHGTDSKRVARVVLWLRVLLKVSLGNVSLPRCHCTAIEL